MEAAKLRATLVPRRREACVEPAGDKAHPLSDATSSGIISHWIDRMPPIRRRRLPMQSAIQRLVLRIDASDIGAGWKLEFAPTACDPATSRPHSRATVTGCVGVIVARLAPDEVADAITADPEDQCQAKQDDRTCSENIEDDSRPPVHSCIVASSVSLPDQMVRNANRRQSDSASRTNCRCRRVTTHRSRRLEVIS